MPKDPNAFLALIEEGDVPGVIALGGAERVDVDDVLATLRRRTLEGGLADFNHDRMSARDRGTADIIAMCRTLPVMSRRRLVEVKDAGDLREDALELLESYLEQPSPETVLVFVFGDIDLRSALAKLLDRKALLCRFDHPKEREMPAHVVRRARRHKLKVSGDAAEALAATVGADLTLLERALEKLALVAHDGEVTPALVEQHVADTHLEDAFAFSAAVARQDRSRAIAALGALQAAREEPLRLVGLLAWQLRQVARVRALLDGGATPQELGRQAGLFGDRLQAALQAARRVDMEVHGARLTRLAKADQLLKGSRQPPWLVMMQLVLDLCPLPPSRRAPPAVAEKPARAR